MQYISVENTGLSYDIVRPDGYDLASFPTKRMALSRANELSIEFGVTLKL